MKERDATWYRGDFFRDFTEYAASVLGDMREPPGEAEYDAVLNLYTAFGCLESPEEDEKVVRAVARALKPGGAFLLETNNLPWLFRHFTERPWDEIADGSMRLFENAYDPPSGRMESRWIRLTPDGERREFRISFRFYLPAEIRAMCDRAGLAFEGLWGSMGGADWEIDSRPMVVLARKP